MSCLLVFFLFIVDPYPPPPLLVIYLVLWASWPWGIARSRLQNTGWQISLQWASFKHVKPVKWWPRDILAACRVVENKRSCLAGPVISGSGCAPSVSLPYKSDHEWKRHWCHDDVQRRKTSEPWSKKAFGSISRPSFAATKASECVQVAETHFLFHENLKTFRGNDEDAVVSVSRKWWFEMNSYSHF